MLDVLAAIQAQRSQAAPPRKGQDDTLVAQGYLLDGPDSSWLCTVSVLGSQPIAGVPATAGDYTGVTAVHVLIHPLTGRPVHVLGPAGLLATLTPAPGTSGTTETVTGLLIVPTSTGTWRDDEAAWDRWATGAFGGVDDVWQSADAAKVSDFSTDDATSYTFTDMSLGEESASRTVIVAVAYRASSAASDVTAVTIGGVSATGDIHYPSSSGDHRGIYYWSANVPTGTTGTVSVTLDETQTLCGIVVWSVATAVTLYDHSAIATEYIDIPSGGHAFCARYWESAWSTSTWTNATEYAHEEMGDSRAAQMAGATVIGDNEVVVITHTTGGDTANAVDCIAVYS